MDETFRMLATEHQADLGSWVRMLSVALVIAAIGATPGLARSERNAPQALNRVTVNHALVTRHRALGRLGDDLRLITDQAAIARHRALGRLTLSAPSAALGRDDNSPGWWKTSVLASAIFTAGVLIGITMTRRRHVHSRRMA